MLIDFARGQVLVKGRMALQVMLGNQPCVKIVDVDFLIMSTHNSAYNTILGKPSLNKIGTIVSTPHLLMKFPTSQGIGQVRVDQQLARQCYMAILKKKSRSVTK